MADRDAGVTTTSDAGDGPRGDGAPACPDLDCATPACPNGNARDRNGCLTCECAPCPNGSPPVCDLVHPPVCTCPASPRTCTDQTTERCTASNPPICDCDPGRACPANECSGPPPPAMPCSVGLAPPASCVRDSNRRTCSWRLAPCPQSELEAAALGWWVTGGASGDCIEFQTYLQLLPAGAGESVLIDDNFCVPAQRGIFILPATWWLDGSTLALWQADRTQGSTRSQFNVAIGTREGKRTLYTKVFRPVDTVTWRSTSTTEYLDAAGTLTSRRTIVVDLRFSAPLPARGEGTCAAAVTLTADGVTSGPPTTSCDYGPVGEVQQLRLRVDASGLSRSQGSALFELLSSSLLVDPTDPTYLYRSWWTGLDGPPSGLMP